MPKRNWSAITQLKDQNLMMAIALAKDPEILAGFILGFPQLFTVGEDNGPLIVPLSLLKKAAFEKSKKDFPEPTPKNLWEIQSQFSLDISAEDNPQLRIPSILYWECPNLDESLYPPIPAEIMSQFIGQKAQAGMTVMYCEKRYMVYNMTFHRMEEHDIGSIFTREPTLNYLSLVDINFIDLDK
jgi:hypothetical protein